MIYWCKENLKNLRNHWNLTAKCHSFSALDWWWALHHLLSSYSKRAYPNNRVLNNNSFKLKLAILQKKTSSQILLIVLRNLCRHGQGPYLCALLFYNSSRQSLFSRVNQTRQHWTLGKCRYFLAKKWWGKAEYSPKITKVQVFGCKIKI